MYMEPATGATAIGLGHEGGGKAVFPRHAFDDTLEKHGVVGSAQGIVYVHEIDFELADAVFGDG